MSNIHKQATTEVRWTTRDVEGSTTLTDARVEIEPIIIEGTTYGDDWAYAKNPDRIVGATITIRGYFTPNGGITMTANQALIEANDRANDLVELLTLQTGIKPGSAVQASLSEYFRQVIETPDLEEDAITEYDDDPATNLGRPNTWEVR